MTLDSHGRARRVTALSRLAESRDMLVPQGTRAVSLVIVTNHSSLVPLIFAKTLVAMRAISLKAVIVNLCPSATRTIRARSALDALGMQSVPVAMGSDVVVGDSSLYDPIVKADAQCLPLDETMAMASVPFSPPTARRPSVATEVLPNMDRRPSLASAPDGSSRAGKVVPTSLQLLFDTYKDAPDMSMTLLLLSAMTDVAEMIREHEDLFVAKTRQVVIMGGVVESSLNDDSPFLIGDDTARNHLLDSASANYVLRRCQELGVQLVITSRFCAYGAAMPFYLFDDMACGAGTLFQQVRETHQNEIRLLWSRVRLPWGHRDRADLPARCDVRWFSTTFCGGSDLTHVSPQADILPHLNTLMLHDVLTMLACAPEALDNFFEVDAKAVSGVEHMVLGRSEKRSGVADANQLRTFLADCLKPQIPTDADRLDANSYVEQTNTRGDPTVGFNFHDDRSSDMGSRAPSGNESDSMRDPDQEQEDSE